MPRHFQANVEALPSPSTHQNLVGPGASRNTKYSRLATTGSPTHYNNGGNNTNSSNVTSTQELIQQQIRQQEQLVQYQDSQLSQMSQSVGSLRNVSSAIGGELDEQAVMLDEFGAEIEQAESKLDASMRKMVRLDENQSSHSETIIILFSFFNRQRCSIWQTIGDSGWQSASCQVRWSS